MSAKKAVSKNEQTRSSGSDSVPCSLFWVIMHETPGEHERSRTAVGPFKSYAKAETWIREDAHATFLATEHALECDPEEWGEKMTIVEERRTLKPVPKVTVSITLKIHTNNVQEDTTSPAGNTPLQK
jgi:hypothetical protein